MQPKSWGLIYFLILLADLCVIAFDIPYARFATKPLLMVILGIYSWSVAGGLYHRARNFIFAALIFSWSGDIFLLFPHFFLPGLVSFLTAHLLYTGFFLTVQPKPAFTWKEGIASLAVAIYAARFAARVAGNAGDMKFAVIAYTVVIALMLLSAIRAFGINSARFGRLCIGGAALFVISDSILALELFITPFPLSGCAVMFTYGVAQWMIVTGSFSYLKTVK